MVVVVVNYLYRIPGVGIKNRLTPSRWLRASRMSRQPCGPTQELWKYRKKTGKLKRDQEGVLPGAACPLLDKLG